MKVLFNENQLRLIKETINPNEAYDEVSSVRTICDGKRNIAFIASVSNDEANIISDMIYDFDLDSMRVPSNPHDAYIIFRKGYENEANELLKIAEKYGGYLHYDASEEDTREIGRLLDYEPESVDEFIRSKSNLQEALELSKAKEFAKIQRSPEVTQRINRIFELLKQKYPNFRTSKREDRLYIPFGSRLKDEIIDTLQSNDFDVTDYDNGIVVNKRNGQETKIGKALARINRNDLLTNYSTDKSKGAISNPSGYMVYSKHQYDIAGMATGRNWPESCMGLYTGNKNRYINCDITEGSFIVYLIDYNDLNIKDPKGRIMIKPFINQVDKNDIIFIPEEKSYGSVPIEFQKEVSNFFNGINVNTKGFVYDKNEKLYNDSNSPSFTNLNKIKNIQDIEGIIFNADDRTKKDLALQNKMVLDYVMNSPRINHYVKESIVDMSKYADVQQYLTAEYMLGFGSPGGLNDLIERFPQLGEIVKSNPEPFKKKFPSLLLKFFPEFATEITSKDIRKMTDTQFFDIFYYRPELFPFMYDKFKSKMKTASDSKRLYYFLEEHPEHLIKSYQLFRKFLMSYSEYEQIKFVSKTLDKLPDLISFYLNNEKPLLDKFFIEPTRSNEVVYRNNDLFYLTYRNYPNFIDEIVQDDLIEILSTNKSLLPFFIKNYRNSFNNVDPYKLFSFLFYRGELIPTFVKYLPETMKILSPGLIKGLTDEHKEYENLLRDI